MMCQSDRYRNKTNKVPFYVSKEIVLSKVIGKEEVILKDGRKIDERSLLERKPLRV